MDLNSLTTLSIHEHAVDPIFHEPLVPLYWTPRQTLFPALEELNVWLISWAEHRALASFDEDPLIGIFTVHQTIVGADLFPKLSTFVLSAGPSSTLPAYSPRLPAENQHIQSYHGHETLYPCSNRYTVSLRDVRQFLVDCAFPALETVRMRGIECVDYDAAEALAELQLFIGDKLLNVEFEPGRASCDIRTTPLGDYCAADELFARLET